MGRPSKLSSIQEREICQRLASGESNRSVAKAYRVGEATIRRIFSAQVPKVRDVAQRLASVELDLAALPVSAQVSARSLADQMKGIQSHYTAAALDGAATAARLHQIARAKVTMLGSDCETEDLKPIMALSETAKSAASLASNMLAANKGKSETTSTLEDLVAGAGA